MKGGVLAECEGVTLRNRVAHFKGMKVKNCSLLSRSCDRAYSQHQPMILLNDSHRKIHQQVFQSQLRVVLHIHSSRAEAGSENT